MPATARLCRIGFLTYWCVVLMSALDRVLQNVTLRIKCSDYLLRVMSDWAPEVVSKELDAVESAIASGVADASQEVRQPSCPVPPPPVASHTCGGTPGHPVLRASYSARQARTAFARTREVAGRRPRPGGRPAPRCADGLGARRCGAPASPASWRWRPAGRLGRRSCWAAWTRPGRSSS